MREEQPSAAKTRPSGLQMANLKFQNMESAICDLKFRVLARTRSSRFAPRSLFNCGIRVESRIVCGVEVAIRIIAPVVRGEA
jgi:hypothetical protein